MSFSEGKSLVHMFVIVPTRLSSAQYGTILHDQKQDTYWTPAKRCASRERWKQGVSDHVWSLDEVIALL
jgi:hypothetical protein